MPTFDFVPVYSIYRDFPEASRNFKNILERSTKTVVHKNWTLARGAMLSDGSSASKRREPGRSPPKAGFAAGITINHIAVHDTGH